MALDLLACKQTYSLPIELRPTYGTYWLWKLKKNTTTFVAGPLWWPILFGRDQFMLIEHWRCFDIEVQACYSLLSRRHPLL